MMKYLSVGIGGMLGAALRYSLGFLLENHTTIFPWDTLIVNITGAFLLAFLLFLPLTKKIVPPVVLTGMTTGMIGAYTTFSTFILESIQLLESHPILAVVYLFSSVLLGVFSSFSGYKMARLFPGEGARS